MLETLNREIIEGIVASNYIGARNFEWFDSGVTFLYDEAEDSKYAKEFMYDQILELRNKNIFLQGMLNQLNYTNQGLLDRLEGNYGKQQDTSGLR